MTPSIRPPSPAIAAAPTGLLLDGVCIELNTRRLFDLTVSVAPGEIVTVMGSSGAGKSTLLAYVAGFLDPVFQARGDIRLDGTSIAGLPSHERRIGLMQQDHLLFPHLSVAGNLAFGLPSGGTDRDAAVKQALKEVELSGFGDRDPASLSGGQRARIALMRTLLAEPRALLLDEPFSKLDRDLLGQVRQFVFATARERRLPVLLVTHDNDDAEQAAGHVLEL